MTERASAQPRATDIVFDDVDAQCTSVLFFEPVQSVYMFMYAFRTALDTRDMRLSIELTAVLHFLSAPPFSKRSQQNNETMKQTINPQLILSSNTES